MTRVRFAPSPTGSLHLGNARTALFNWLVARRSSGTMILRIEDTDTDREQEGSEAGILEDLRWLGLAWDDGPYRQSDRRDLYAQAAHRLVEGGHAFFCACTEEKKEPGKTRHLDPCRDRGLAGQDGSAVRFRAPLDLLSVVFEDRLHGRIEVPAIEIEDFVLLRRDGRPTYNFAVVVDDVAMDVTLVIRGDDHLSNTPRQVLLYRALGRALPEFAHLPMVRGQDGGRLSKRTGAMSVADCRVRGYTPEGLVNALALLGWSPSGDRTIVTLDEMLREFDFDRVSSSPAMFDPAKLDWIQAQHIHRMDADRLTSEVAARLGVPASAWTRGVAEMLRTSLERFDQVSEKSRAVFFPGIAEVSSDIRSELSEGRAALESFAAIVAEAPLTAERWTAAKSRMKTESGLKGKALFHPIRLAVTGEASGPELDRLLPLVTEGAAVLPEVVPSLQQRIQRALEAAR